MTDFSPEFTATPPALPDVSGNQDLGLILRGDFYRTFQFSQGSLILQRDVIYPLVAAQYRAVLPEDMLACIPETLETEMPKVDELRLPSGHRKSGAVLADRGPGIFRGEWREFGDALTSPKSRAEAGNFAFNRLVGKLIHGMIRRDNQFLRRDEGRSRSSSHSDPYHSQFRQYVLLGESTHSQAFDGLFEHARQRNTPLRAVGGRYLLKRRWERTHRGERFVPDTAGAAPHGVTS